MPRKHPTRFTVDELEIVIEDIEVARARLVSLMHKMREGGLESLELFYAKSFLAAIDDIGRFSESGHESLRNEKLKNVLRAMDVRDEDEAGEEGATP
jgi:hypothetical protein